MYHPGSEEGHTMIFLEDSAEEYYRPYYCKKRGIATYYAGHLICSVSRLDRIRFRNWAAVASCDIPLQQENLNQGSIFCIVKVT